MNDTEISTAELMIVIEKKFDDGDYTKRRFYKLSRRYKECLYVVVSSSRRSFKGQVVCDETLVFEANALCKVVSFRALTPAFNNHTEALQFMGFEEALP